MAGEPDPVPTPPAPPPVPGGSFLDKIGPHTLKIILGACVVGVISCFLPAISVSVDPALEALGAKGASSSGVYNDWRGVISLIGYIGIGVMAGLMLQKPHPNAKQLTLVALITSGVVVLMALLLLLAVNNSTGAMLGMKVSMGFGPILHLLSSLVVAAGAVLEAKKIKIF